MSYIVHALIGGLGAISGYYARGLCRHPRHRIPAAIFMIVLESIISVQVVG